MASQAAEKPAFATGLYQGMTLVMAKSLANKRRALAPVRLSTVRNDFFRGLFSRAALGAVNTGI